MKIIFIIFLLIFCGLRNDLFGDQASPNNINQGEVVSSLLPPIVYPMKIIYVFEDNKTEFIIMAGNGGFKSVTSLKEWVKKLQPGTTLEFEMSCRRLGNEPLVSSEEEMNDFKTFCEQHKINLIIRPAG